MGRTLFRSLYFLSSKVSKQEIEKDLSFQELKVIREGAFMKLKRENQLVSY